MNTFSADVERSGECRIPEVFGDNYRLLSAALDTARAYVETGRPDATWTAPELDAAARAADDLAKQCRDYARRARGSVT